MRLEYEYYESFSGEIIEHEGKLYTQVFVPKIYHLESWMWVQYKSTTIGFIAIEQTNQCQDVDL
jgi:hypothetical protein